MTKFEQNKALTQLCKDLPEVAEIAVSVMREPLDKLEKAFQAFFSRVKAGEAPGYPRFKGAGWWKSIGPLDVHAGMVKRAGKGRYNIRIKGLPTLRVKSNGELPDSENLVALRIKREGRKLWACLTYKIEVAEEDGGSVFPIRLAHGVGIDMGVSDRAAMSDGSRVERVHVDKRRLQRKLSRANRGSYSP